MFVFCAGNRGSVRSLRVEIQWNSSVSLVCQIASGTQRFHRLHRWSSHIFPMKSSISGGIFFLQKWRVLAEDFPWQTMWIHVKISGGSTDLVSPKSRVDHWQSHSVSIFFNKKSFFDDKGDPLTILSVGHRYRLWGGYMIGSYATSKYTFDLHPEDVYFCTADCGWITGRSEYTYLVVHKWDKWGQCPLITGVN